MAFDGGHTVALGHPSDAPDHWAIQESDELTADEESFVEATVSTLIHGDLPSLAAAYPALPSWYTDSLASYVAPLPIDTVQHIFLPVMLR